MEKEIINKVAESGLITINPEEFYTEGERVVFDIKNYLYKELVLKEKDFREFIKTHNWAEYTGKLVAVTCSNDAIVATWAYMLIAASLQPFAKKVLFGNRETLETILFHDALLQVNPEEYRNKRIILNGCSDKPVPLSAYVALTILLQPVVKSIMYGEACSSVPVFKKGVA